LPDARKSSHFFRPSRSGFTISAALIDRLERNAPAESQVGEKTSQGAAFWRERLILPIFLGEMERDGASAGRTGGIDIDQQAGLVEDIGNETAKAQSVLQEAIAAETAARRNLCQFQIIVFESPANAIVIGVHSDGEGLRHEESGAMERVLFTAFHLAKGQKAVAIWKLNCKAEAAGLGA
jgi:hypothetical protein